MNEDYQVHTHQELGAAYDQLRNRMQQRFHIFPQIVADHVLPCELFEEDFSLAEQ